MELIRRAATERHGLAPGRVGTDRRLRLGRARAPAAAARVTRARARARAAEGAGLGDSGGRPDLAGAAGGRAAGRRADRGLRRPRPGPAERRPARPRGALAYFQRYFDGIPPRISLLAEKSQTAFEGYTLLHRGALREGPLPPVLVELILCGINASEFASDFVQIHADAARRQGASDEQLFGAVLSVIPVSGAAAWPGAAAALRSRLHAAASSPGPAAPRAVASSSRARARRRPR